MIRRGARSHRRRATATTATIYAPNVDATAGTSASLVRPRRSALWLDAVVGAALTCGALLALDRLPYRGPAVVAALACVATTTAVGYRRIAPVTAMMVAVSGIAVYERVTYDDLGGFVAAAVVLTAYMVGRRAAGGIGSIGSIGAIPPKLVVAYTLAAMGVASATGRTIAAPPVAWIPIVLLPGAVGVLVTRRDRLAAQLSSTVHQLEVEQAIRAAQVVHEERNRVARDLHDVVAHSVSVMVIQAGAARLVAAGDPGAARRARGRPAHGARRDGRSQARRRRTAQRR